MGDSARTSAININTERSRIYFLLDLHLFFLFVSYFDSKSKGIVTFGQPSWLRRNHNAVHCDDYLSSPLCPTVSVYSRLKWLSHRQLQKILQRFGNSYYSTTLRRTTCPTPMQQISRAIYIPGRIRATLLQTQTIFSSSTVRRS